MGGKYLTLRGFRARAQRCVHEQRSEEASADAHRDDRGKRLPRRPDPLAVPDAIGEVLDLVQNFVHVRHHVLPVDVDDLVLGRPRRDVKHRPVLGAVDVLAAVIVTQKVVNVLYWACIGRCMEQSP